MAIPTITPLPVPPQRTSPPADWAVRADAFVTAEYNMVNQLNAQVIPGINSATDLMDGVVEQTEENVELAQKAALDAQIAAAAAGAAVGFPNSLALLQAITISFL